MGKLYELVTGGTDNLKIALLYIANASTDDHEVRWFIEELALDLISYNRDKIVKLAPRITLLEFNAFYVDIRSLTIHRHAHPFDIRIITTLERVFKAPRYTSSVREVFEYLKDKTHTTSTTTYIMRYEKKGEHYEVSEETVKLLQAWAVDMLHLLNIITK